MKFLIVAGHEGTTGAVSGKLIEEVLTEQLSEKIVKFLKDQGHEAIEPNFNLYDAVDAKMSYINGFDYVLEVHFNQTAGANGTEIYVAEGITKIGVEKAIMQRLGKWLKLRDADGVKTAKFKTLMGLKGKVDAALLEVAFIDSKSDMAVYLKNIDAIAQDIAYGILEGFGAPIKDLTPKQDPVKPSEDLAPDGKLFQVAIGAYKNRANANDELAKAKSAGLDPYLVLIDDPRGK